MQINKKTTLLVTVLAASVIAFMGSFRGPSNKVLRDSSVLLTGSAGQCSGVKIVAPSGKSYVLTADHCASLVESGMIVATTEDGEKHVLRLIKESDESDLMVFEGLGDFIGRPIAKDLNRFDHLRSFTHGHGAPTYETDGSMVGEMVAEFPMHDIIESEEDAAKCLSKKKNVITDSLFFKVCGFKTRNTISTLSTTPGSSGGMVVNRAGELVGIVTGGDGFFSYLVTLKDIQLFTADL